MNDYTPYTIDSAIASLERTIKRLWVLCIVLVVFLVVTNVAWIYYESQWQVVETTQEVWQENEGGNGNNVFIGGDNYGEDTSTGENND